MTKETIYIKAHEISKVLRKNALNVDQQNIFPQENIDLLKKEGFMKLFIPTEYGGYGLCEKDLFLLSKILSAGCLSTSVIWSMHYQQVMVLVNHLDNDAKSLLLNKISKEDIYIGSVTTEINKGGTLLKCDSYLKYKNDKILLERFAPIVTGGDKCDAYLITMRRSEDSAPNDVVLVYCLKEDLKIELVSQPNMLGMRGTYSSSIDLQGLLHNNSILNPELNFNQIAIKTMIPLGHLVWAACWIGSVEAAYNYVKNDIFRNPKANKNLMTDDKLKELSKIQMNIDMVKVYFDDVSDAYIKYKDDYRFLSSSKFQLKINNLKILSSDILYKCVNDLIDLVGLKYGYLISNDSPLERALRDMRSSSLMFHNDRLLTINGKLVLFEN